MNKLPENSIKKSSLNESIDACAKVINQKLLFVDYDSKKSEIRSRICSNCGTSSTSTWRNLGDQIVCNACKCFYRKHGKSRPIHMRKDTIISRQRKSCKPTMPNEGMFLIKDDLNFDTDSTSAAEAVCKFLEHLKNL